MFFLNGLNIAGFGPEPDPSIVAELERRAKEILPENVWKMVNAIKTKSYGTQHEACSTEFDSVTHEDVYEAICGHFAHSCRTIDDFFHPALVSLLDSFFGEEEAGHIRRECELETELPRPLFFTSQPSISYRPPYRSGRIGDHAGAFFDIIIRAIAFKYHGLDLEAAMAAGAPPQRLESRIALALRDSDSKILGLVREAILGDNDAVRFSRRIIGAIVKSGDAEALDLLGKLLLAAKTQEGLRQAILETCDRGTVSSYIYFIRLILENNLCRFSSVIRAFDTWTGLGLGNREKRTSEKCMRLALKYLSDESQIESGLESNDTIEIYMALWSLACRDIYEATESSRRLLDSTEKYKRLVGWYFITHTADEAARHNAATEHLGARDPEELAWVCMNLYAVSSMFDRAWYDVDRMWQEHEEKDFLVRTYPNKIYPAEATARAELFAKIAETAVFIGNKSKKFSESVFPWYSLELSAEKPCMCLIMLAAYDRSPELTARLAEYLPFMGVGLRMAYYLRLLNPKIPEQRAMLLEGLSDRSPSVKGLVVNIFRKRPLEENEVLRLTDILTTKKAGLRKGIMALFSEQSESIVRPALKALLGSADKNQLIAGVELLKIFGEKNPAITVEYSGRLSTLSADPELGPDVSILLGHVMKETKDGYSAENGYGLYDPLADAFSGAVWANKRPEAAAMSHEELKAALNPDENSLFGLFDRIADVFYRNRDFEYETDSGDQWGGSRQKALLGDDPYRVYLKAGKLHERYGNPITDYPLADEWVAAAGAYAQDKQKLAATLALFANRFRQSLKYSKWFMDSFEGMPVGELGNALCRELDKRTGSKGLGFVKVYQILDAINNTGRQNLFDFSLAIYVNLINRVPPERLGDRNVEEEQDGRREQYDNESNHVLADNYLAFWRGMAYRHIENDEQFTAWFNEMWYEYITAGSNYFYGLNDEDVFRAHQLGLIPDDVVYAYITTSYRAGDHMRAASFYTSGWSREILSKYPDVKRIVDITIDRVVSIEENRGELPTDMTGIAVNIGPFDGGIKHFIKLLTALGDTGFHRGYVYYWRKETTKKESLSYLLRMCRPAPGDTPEALRDAIKQFKISEKRLFQAAVYAPMWAGMLEEAMGIRGLKCGVWFFHAHVNEYFSAEKETETAVFSAVSPQRFRDGTFDKDWFFEAYDTLGEKRFDELYKNAKFITDSSVAHRRSQLYADAVLGRMDKALTKAEIIEKRNQEKLRAYALIPLDEKNEHDAAERYEFIRQFGKESRQFGAQRQASERTACQIALENLAITTGYADVDRMTWALEGANAETDAKRLREQTRRARQSMETMMISRSPFTVQELGMLLEHPVLREMVSALVFAAGDAIGFPGTVGEKPGLIDITGEAYVPGDDEKLIVAHPHDFVSRNNWSDYQRHLYQNKIQQPFKQVFREYYPITADELAAVDTSRRYAGNQVQPKKAMALLKSRGWTTDYYEGLQRVWHKEKLIARIFAMADWFSPSDIEAPTLEVIRFFGRDEPGAIPFADIPPVIFSETMRDIDLAVSVAHAGGVNPEASHSTIEMRIAIARELLVLLSVENVTFQTAHARVAGKYGEYSVHMGSGVVHKSGAGMVSVMPVHSQSRGRIFLPFVDNDPKTAEIISKILLFANDKKIKDPGILGQIM